ncbi:MAG: hypothetical protein HY278_08225, partial [candidate division NC10 bacterium]|nr:hypothetical protein [candidate division NC10 bacterium]
MATAPKTVSSARLVLALLAGTILRLLLICPPDSSARTGPMILSLGDDSYLTWAEVESRSGAVVKRELGESPLTDFSLLVLSNISYASLPEAVRDGLQGYLSHGGSVLVTGGQQSYGSGGYAGTELADLLPLRPSRDDFGYHPYGPTLLLQPGHPIFKGVEIPTMGFFNELELNGGAVEIAQYRKAFARTIIVDPGNPARTVIEGGGARLPMPLIAERSVGAGS